MNKWLTIFLTILSHNASALCCYNNDVAYIYSRLTQKPDIFKTDTLNDFDGIFLNHTISCHSLATDSCLQHIGLKIFSNDILFENEHSIYQFAERKLLKYCIASSKKEILDDLYESKSKLYLNGNLEFGKPGFDNNKKIVELLSNIQNCEISYDSINTTLKVIKGKSNLLFVFKNTFFTVTGMNKIEADSILFEKLTSKEIIKAADVHYHKKALNKYNDSVFLYQGKRFSAGFSDEYYLLKVDDNFKPLFDKKYPVQSFISSIINADVLQKHIKIVLEHSQYYRKRTAYAGLDEVISLLKKDHELYFGIEDSSSGMIGTLIAYNRVLNYIHLFYLVTDTSSLFGEHPEYFCKLYSYIPTDNIKNLFSSRKTKKF